MNNKKNILITGANGQLGMEFRELEKDYPLYGFLFASKEELSIDDKQSVDNYFSQHRIHYCINCAAYTAVDKAGSEKEIALSINAVAVGDLAGICKKYNAGFIHFSTDYVFNGNAREPYLPTDATDPVNFYGQTKLEGERHAFANNAGSMVIRTSWVYSRFGKNFVKTMLRLMREKQSIGVVTDQYGCPTYAADMAHAVMKIIGDNNLIPGIYHYCNQGVISWYEFASAIKEISNSNCIVNPIISSDYPTPARRPAYSALDTSLTSSRFGLSIPGWKESLAHCLKLIAQSN